MITVEAMRALEDGCGIAKAALMQNAGRGLANLIRERFNSKGKKILVVAYHGNNGGDGLVAANYLAEDCEVDVYFIGDENRLKEEAKTNYDAALRNDRIQFFDVSEYELDLIDFSSYDVIIDAMLGIGMKGEINPIMGAVIDKINAADAQVVAVDVPTGVDADTGTAAGKAVDADMIASFHDHKPGIDPEKAVIIDIGIPKP